MRLHRQSMHFHSAWALLTFLLKQPGHISTACHGQYLGLTPPAAGAGSNCCFFVTQEWQLSASSSSMMVIAGMATWLWL